MNIEELLNYMDASFAITLVPLVIMYVWFGLDDTILDLYAWFKGLHAGNTKPLHLRSLRRKKQKRIAILVAAWKEHEVIARMIRGNFQQIEYSNFQFYVGVYPNDLETIQALYDLSAEFDRLHIVINTENGPTSKGQMLNQVVETMTSHKNSRGDCGYDVLLIHDSEDIIHPYALLAVNAAMDDHEFVQVPVLSFSVEASQWVAGIYMDEFAEVHLKDLRVRNQLTGSFPAAGVGMAISRKLVESYLRHQSNKLFNEKSLTEDYELGLTASDVGGRCQFICSHILRTDGTRELLATREYFPKRVKRSIKQKARWTVGISFQGWERLGWRGGFWQHFFLYRDRKGPWANAIVFAGTMIWIYAALRWGFAGIKIFEGYEVVENGIFLTLAMMGNRMFQKIYACAKVYGWLAALGAPFRTIGANVINFLASFLALKQYLKSRLGGGGLAWAKTEHELPINFGSNVRLSKKKSPAMAAWVTFCLYLSVAAEPAWAHSLHEFWQPSDIPKVQTDFAQLTTNAKTSSLFVNQRDPRFECVRVYYDASRDPQYLISRYFAIFLENLLGHFPEFQTIVEPIENYRSGDIETCKASFYIGSHFDAQIPKSFFDDYANTKRSVVWMGYSIWRYDVEALERALGIRYQGYLTSLDWQKKDERNRPTFFKDILYKGETFAKYGELSAHDSSVFNAPFEMAAVEVRDPNAKVLALARHNGTGKHLPYAIQKGNRFYIADIPFTYMHEGDRYLVFADLLFDILGAEPRNKNLRPAVFRLEDVHPRIPALQINAVASVAKKNEVPLHIALIPIFSDPLFEMNRAPGEEYIPMHSDAQFMSLVNELKKQETVFIWHGVTHQYEKLRNPYTGASGDDFEFWDIKGNHPVPNDSVDWVLGRLGDGWSTLTQGQLRPQVWEVPHYLASVLDYTLFSRVFSWTIGRVAYRPASIENLPKHDESLWFENSGVGGDGKRRRAFASLRASEIAPPSGQLFPYEIYGDYYGQRVLPENLGHPQPAESEQGMSRRTIDEILKDAKRNMKLRDVWASVFVHPQLVNTKENGGLGRFPGDASEFERLIKELKAMGYQFVNIEKYISDKKTRIRPPTIQVPLGQR